MWSAEYNLDRYPNSTRLQSIRSNKHGAHMIFAFDPNRSNFSNRQKPALENVARILFSDELVYHPEHKYAKDW